MAISFSLPKPRARTDRRQKHHQCRAYLADQLIEQGRQAHLPGLVDIRVLLGKPTGNDVHFRLCLLDSHTCLESPRHNEVTDLPDRGEIAFHVDRRLGHTSQSPHVEIRFLRSKSGATESKRRWHHSDDDVAFPIQLQHATKNRRFGTEPPLPEGMTEDDGGLANRTTFFIRKRPS
jgi:hypothetical protein